ncbi:MAG: four helix bundle protein [Candidatus Symbiothrix sp.]|nr:four helix bundle protein [Candidatus Symbiothrix sp.]
MATYDQLMIYKQAYDLTTDLMPLTKSMDRGYKFTLGERINNASVEMLLCVYRINITSGDRDRYFVSAREQVELVRLLLRLMKDLRLVTTNRFTRLNESVESISKQLTGWHRSSVDNTKKNGRLDQMRLF